MRAGRGLARTLLTRAAVRRLSAHRRIAAHRLAPGRITVPLVPASPVNGRAATHRLIGRHARRAVRPLTMFTAFVRSPAAGKAALAAAVLGCLALGAMAQGMGSSGPALGYTDTATTTMDRSYRASRSALRDTPGSTAGAQLQSALAASAAEAEKQAAAAKAAAEAKAKAARWAADNPTPVAGLTQRQMNNALRIVGEGKALGLPKRAYVLAVACAMQESALRNLASNVLPESYNYPHEGSGTDHDSVGLFQQRPSTGWGAVKDLMTPAYAAKQFYDALVAIPGWQSMALSYAIQAVQISAFPDAYAQHEWAAQKVVDALT